MTNEKQFPKTINQKELNYDLFTKLPKSIVRDISPSSFKVKRCILPLVPLQNSYSHLTKVWHRKPKISIWTKLLKSSLLAKYLRSVAETLMCSSHEIFSNALAEQWPNFQLTVALHLLKKFFMEILDICPLIVTTYFDHTHWFADTG